MMNLQINAPVETTMPHHAQIVCRHTGPDEWVLDIDKLTVWATNESVEGFAYKVLEGLIEEFGDTYVQTLLNAAAAKVYARAAS